MPKILELTTQPELAQGGEAVARAEDGRVVFIEGGAPSETVKVEILEEKKNFFRGKVKEVRVPSKDRVDPACAHFSECGGCSLQHISAEAQRRSKTVALVETLRRVGKVEAGSYTLEPIWAGQPYGYRTRARMAVGKQGQLGYRRGSSHQVVQALECPVLSPPLEKARAALAKALSDKPPAIRELVEVTLVGNAERALVQLPRALAPYGARLEEAGVELAEGAKTLRADDGLGPLTLTPEVFAQANHAGNRALVEAVRDWAGAGPQMILELYSGSGNFTRALLPLASRLVALEADHRAAGIAKSTLKGALEVRGKAVEVELARVRAEGVPYQLCVLDPPRTGLSGPARENLAALRIPRLLYVSCDPPTFARDVQVLAASGYRLTRIKPFDLYPQTGHLEVLGELVLVGA